MVIKKFFFIYFFYLEKENTNELNSEEKSIPVNRKNRNDLKNFKRTDSLMFSEKKNWEDNYNEDFFVKKNNIKKSSNDDDSEGI